MTRGQFSRGDDTVIVLAGLALATDFKGVSTKITEGNRARWQQMGPTWRALNRGALYSVRPVGFGLLLVALLLVLMMIFGTPKW